MKKIVIFLLFVSYISNSQKFKNRIRLWTRSNFGVDNIDNILNNVPNILKLHITYKCTRLQKDKEVINNNEAEVEKDNNAMYIPKVSSLRKDLELNRYLIKDIVFNKKIKGNVFLDKYGISLGFDIKGVDSDYTNFDEKLGL